MRLAVTAFKGATPRIHPRLIAEDAAQVARNVHLDNGALASVHSPSLAYNFGSAVQSIYLHDSTWLGWNAIVDVAPAPIVANRLYLTGNGVPKMIDAGVTYSLALPSPVAAPTIAALSTVDTGKSETILYAYTHVTSFGEESRPSPVSAALKWSAGVQVQVNGFSAVPGGRGIVSRRIYRSQTSTSGITDLYFVAEIPVATASYTHDLTAAPLQEPIPSTHYDTPPDSMSGITPMPNGMMAAFSGKELYFCEPYQPHAWPNKYTLRVDFPIVGLCAFGSILAILTSGTPYIAQGSHPESMAMEKMDKSMPCMSRRAIVDIGYACYFPTHDGLAAISATDSQIVTRGIFTREQWLAMDPASFVAQSYDGRYYFTHVYASGRVFDGGSPGIATTAAIDGGAPSGASGGLTYDFGGPTASFGVQRLGSLDISQEMPFFMDSDIILPTAMHRAASSGALYMQAGPTSVYLWDDPTTTRASKRWRSKRFAIPFTTNMGAILVQTEEALGPTDTMTCEVFADGVPVAKIAYANEPERLPGGFMAREWEIELTGTATVKAVYVANTMDELVG